jgi:parallel beta-helix repeat protein
MTIALDSELPSVTDSTKIVGRPGVILDGNQLKTSNIGIELNTGNDGNEIYYLEMRNFPNRMIKVGSWSNTIAYCTFAASSHNIFILGSNNTFGPENVVSNNTQNGVESLGANTIIGNRIYGCNRSGILLSAADNIVRGNLIYGNAMNGIEATDRGSIWYNTIYGNTLSGILLQSPGNDVQGNVLSNNSAYGIDADDSAFATLNHNDYFLNFSGNCSACTLGPQSLTDDPMYIDVGTSDWRVKNGSPVIDAGPDLGIDVNGAASGNYNGNAPDMGAFETP